MCSVLQIALRDVAGGILARGAIFLSIWVVGLAGGSLLGEMDWSLVAAKPWIGLPRLFPYGGPGFGWEFTAAAILGVAVGYFGSMVESLGDYAATCAVSGETYRVRHMKRGIFAEGAGSLLSVCLGAIPCTSYTQNAAVQLATGDDKLDVDFGYNTCGVCKGRPGQKGHSRYRDRNLGRPEPEHGDPHQLLGGDRPRPDQRRLPGEGRCEPQRRSALSAGLSRSRAQAVDRIGRLPEQAGSGISPGPLFCSAHRRFGRRQRDQPYSRRAARRLTVS